VSEPETNLKMLARAWYVLMRDKWVADKRVINRVSKEQISVESLSDPAVAEQVGKYGYYDVTFKHDNQLLNALQALVELGYVTKRQEKMHGVGIMMIRHPYEPFIFPTGAVGIRHSGMKFETYTFDSKQYAIFQEEARIFSQQINARYHKHITKFEYGLNFEYDAEVYEVNDRYFDAIAIHFSEKENKLLVWITEPVIEERSKKQSKNWRKMQEVSASAFLERSRQLEDLIDGLEWKKKTRGILIDKDEAWILGNKKREEAKEENWLSMPNFLDYEAFSFENNLSTRFEDQVAQYLSEKYHYEAITRYKPPYLGENELDVYATKGVREKNITICECKFRTINQESPVTIAEVNELGEKVRVIKDNEGRIARVRFRFWLVTNSRKLDEGVPVRAKEEGIDIMQAELSSNWQHRSDWKVTKISVLKAN
jgi:hypothetical protein